MNQSVAAWMPGDYAIVQIPEEGGCFKTFSGVVVEVLDNGCIEVSPIKKSGDNVICQPEWLYPEGWLN